VIVGTRGPIPKYSVASLRELGIDDDQSLRSRLDGPSMLHRDLLRLPGLQWAHHITPPLPPTAFTPFLLFTGFFTMVVCLSF
jgi:hypothetical protein